MSGYSIVQRTSDATGSGGGATFSSTNILESFAVTMNTAAATTQTVTATLPAQWCSIVNTTQDWIRVTFTFSGVWSGARQVLLAPNGGGFVKENNRSDQITNVILGAVSIPTASNTNVNVSTLTAIAATAITGIITVTFGQN